MPASRTLALATVFGCLTIGAVTGCSSVYNRLTDGVVRPEPVTVVTISGGAGDVTVKPDATVKGVDIRRTVRYLGHAPSTEDTIRFDGSAVTLKTGCGTQCSASYEVLIPAAGVKVNGDNGSGDLNLQGVSDVDVEVGSGSVIVDGATGTVRATTGSGDIKVTDIAGVTTLTTSSGSVTGRDLRGSLTTIEVSSGRIKLELAGVGDVKATTSSGNIDVTVPDRSCRITVRTSSGDQDLQVATDPASPHLLDLRADSGDVTVRSSV